MNFTVVILYLSDPATLVDSASYLFEDFDSAADFAKAVRKGYEDAYVGGEHLYTENNQWVLSFDSIDHYGVVEEMVRIQIVPIYE